MSSLEAPALEESYDETMANFVFGNALGALNNLIDNSIYWLRVRWPEDSQSFKRRIYINISLDLGDGPAVVVADTGPGFADEPSVMTRPSSLAGLKAWV